MVLKRQKAPVKVWRRNVHYGRCPFGNAFGPFGTLPTYFAQDDDGTQVALSPKSSNAMDGLPDILGWT